MRNIIEKNWRKLRIVAIGLLLMPLVLRIFFDFIFTKEYIIYREIYSFIEHSIALICFLSAYYLYLYFVNSRALRYLLLATAFLVISMFFFMHGFIPEDTDLGVLFYILSGLSAGITLAAGILGEAHLEKNTAELKKITYGSILLVAIFLVVCSLFAIRFRYFLGPMIAQGRFTHTAEVPNLFFAGLFFASAALFFLRYKKTEDGEDFLFFVVFLLFFEMRVIASYSRIWGSWWWLSSLLRLCISLILAIYLLRHYARSVSNFVSEIEERRKTQRELILHQQQLKAANQQLVATEQQLRASNQRLGASEQQLRASNQQLRAHEQQLRNEITERKKAEEEIRDSEERLKILFEFAPDAYYLNDLIGTLIDGNRLAEKLTGYKREELVGKSFLKLNLLPPNQMLKAAALLAKNAMGKSTGPDEFTLNRKDGSKVTAEISTFPVKIKDHTLVLGIAHDITERKKTEEELQDSKRRIEFILGATKTGLDIIDSNFNMVYIDPEWAKIYGEPKGKKCYEYFAGRTEMCSGCGIPKALETKKPVVAEEVLPKEGGRPVMVTTIPFQSEKGEWLIAEVNVDITERKRKEEKLRQSENKYRVLTETLPQKVFYKDRNSVYVSCNQSYAQDLKIKPEEIAGKTDYDFFPKELAEKYRADDKVIMEFEEIKNIEEKYIKDGREIIVQTVKTPVRDEKSNTVGILGIFWDITERKNYEDKILHAAKEWRTTFDSIGDLISIHDKDFKIVRLNMAFANAFKMQPQEILGETCYELLHKEKGPLAGCPHQLTMQNKKISVTEMFISQLGIYAEITCSPIFNEKGEAVGVVHIAKDISMRKEMEKKERLAQLGKLVADMAHEVNNPLMIISGNAQLSLMEGTSSKEVKDNLKIIFEETKRAKDIIQRLLTFSRPSKGERKEVDINRSIDSVVALLENQFKLANIEIKRNYSENLPLVTVDESQMREVFINLLNNSREAMASGGTIEVATFLEEGLIRIDFKDTGCGMTEEARKRLFEPFFTTKEKGTGLGLPVCYGIIKAHNGDLTFKSEPDKGTTATILLPFGGASNA